MLPLESTTEGDRPTVLPCGFPPARSRFAWGFVTLPLACASDSLVRVSRRVERDRYARVPNVLGPPPRPKGDGDRPPEGARWFPRPDAPFRRSASAGRILPALAPPPHGESSRLGPIDGPSAPRGELGAGDRELSPSDSRTPELAGDDLPPTVADPVRFPFDDFKRF